MENDAGTNRVTVGDTHHSTGVAVGPYASSTVTIYQTISPDDHQNQRRHSILRQEVSRFWIDGYLHGALYDEVFLNLEMHQAAGLVDTDLWEFNWPQAQPSPQPVAVATRIADLFDAVGQRLLILGEPGSGKTITLLTLARDLLARAAADPTHVSPVILHLSSWASSWAENRQPFAQWLVEELNLRYKIPKNVAQGWIEKDELLLLLDGLDEVAPLYRDMCVATIKQFLRNHMVRMAVCCRTAEYEALSAPLSLHGAVVLHPLTPDQIEAYLDKAGAKLSALRAFLYQDRDLYAMATSPLFLNIMSLAYQGLSTVDFTSDGSTQARHRHLFDAYIRRLLFGHREVQQEYEAQDTLKWLQWLASRLLEHGQADFLIEWLQPSWLKTSTRRPFPVMALMFLWGPLYGLGAGAVLGGAFGLMAMGLQRLIAVTPVGMSADLATGLMLGLAVGFCVGLVGAIVNTINGGVQEIRPADHTFRLWALLRARLATGLYWGLLYGLAFHLFHRYGSNPANALMLGLVGALVASLVAGFIPMKPRRLFRWTPGNSFKSLVRTGARGVEFGLLVGTAFGLIVATPGVMMIGDDYGLMAMVTAIGPPTWDILLLAWPAGAAGGLLFRLLFEPEERAEFPTIEETRMPNQGIKVSAQNALTLGLASGLLGLAIGLGIGARNGELYLALLFGPLFGLAGGLMGGADAVVKHCILRTLLCLHDVAPRHYPRFLDHCVGRILLHKIGGGYRFTHRLLMEHVAAMTDDHIQRLAEDAA